MIKPLFYYFSQITLWKKFFFGLATVFVQFLLSSNFLNPIKGSLIGFLTVQSSLSVCLSVWLSVCHLYVWVTTFHTFPTPKNKGTCSTGLETGCKPVLLSLKTWLSMTTNLRQWHLMSFLCHQKHTFLSLMTSKILYKLLKIRQTAHHIVLIWFV